MTIREKALQIALTFAGKTNEVGGNNHGPTVRKFLAAVGLSEGYAWCDAFVSYCLLEANGGKPTGIESASVEVSYLKAKERGWLKARPFRADVALFDFDGDGSFDDHTGFVVKVLRLGPLLTLRTVEGNTSSGDEGSQDDGAGVYTRTRVIRRSRVAFARVPGDVPTPPVKPTKRFVIKHRRFTNSGIPTDMTTVEPEGTPGGEVIG